MGKQTELELAESKTMYAAFKNLSDNCAKVFQAMAKSFGLMVIICATLFLFTGCFGFRPATVITYPDAPCLIKQVKGSYALVYVYDKSKNKMIEAGWLNLKYKFEGFTLSKYNWENIIQKRASHGK